MNTPGYAPDIVKRTTNLDPYTHTYTLWRSLSSSCQSALAGLSSARAVRPLGGASVRSPVVDVRFLRIGKSRA